MEIPEMTQNPFGPAMTIYPPPDDRPEDWIPGVDVRAVGWLGTTIPYMGDVPPECLRRLEAAYRYHIHFADGTWGWYECQICIRQMGAMGDKLDFSRLGENHFLVRHQEVIFMAPRLITHYIRQHSYRPPDEFVDAVLHGVFLTNRDVIVRSDHPLYTTTW